MRHLPVLIPTALLACLAVSAGSVRAGDAIVIDHAKTEPKQATFVNPQLSSRNIALNQVLRLEFTTSARQIDGVDIAAAVINAFSSGEGQWRLIGKPVVSETSRPKANPSERERPTLVNVVVVLLPRRTGDVPLPPLLLTWLQGNQFAEFGIVQVAKNLAIGNQQSPLPAEIDGIAGHSWGSKLATVTGKGTPLANAKAETNGPTTRVVASDNLTLLFHGEELGEAILVAPGLSLESARDSFLKRWGMPQIETAAALVATPAPGSPTGSTASASLTWILGWTRITASESAQGVTLAFVREDIQARLNRNRVAKQVFEVLDLPPAAETPAQVESRRRAEIDAEAARALERMNLTPPLPKDAPAKDAAPKEPAAPVRGQ